MDNSMLKSALREILPPLTAFIQLLLGDNWEFWWAAFKRLPRKEPDIWLRVHKSLQRKGDMRLKPFSFSMKKSESLPRVVGDLISFVEKRGGHISPNARRALADIPEILKDESLGPELEAEVEFVSGTMGNAISRDDFRQFSMRAKPEILEKYDLAPCHLSDVLRYFVLGGPKGKITLVFTTIFHENGRPKVFSLQNSGYDTWRLIFEHVEEFFDDRKYENGNVHWLFRRLKED